MNSNRQKGAALFISLMLLFLMTIIGLNALDTATSDERMALNTQHEQEVFHAAESAVTVLKRNDAALDTAIGTGTFGPTAYAGQPNVTAAATIAYVTCGDPPAGYDLGKFVSQDFAITGTAQLVNSSAQAVHVQGIGKVAPLAGGC